MAGNQNASKGREKNSCGSNEPQLNASKPKDKDRHKEGDAVAQATGVSSATAGRALTLVEKRPDLAEKVSVEGKPTLKKNAAVPFLFIVSVP